MAVTELLAATELLAVTEIRAATELLAATERDEMLLSTPFVSLCGLRDRATVNTVELITECLNETDTPGVSSADSC